LLTAGAAMVSRSSSPQTCKTGTGPRSQTRSPPCTRGTSIHATPASSR
jgi:hypothetical protein